MTFMVLVLWAIWSLQINIRWDEKVIKNCKLYSSSPIHNVKVQIISTALHHSFTFPPELRQIAAQNRRSNFRRVRHAASALALLLLHTSAIHRCISKQKSCVIPLLPGGGAIWKKKPTPRDLIIDIDDYLLFF